MEKYKVPNRLQDILSLITILAQGKSTYRSISGLQTDLIRIPLSSNSWLDIIRDHPEFFRYDPREGKRHNISLLIRHQKKQVNKSADHVLSLEETKLLLDTAILINEKQNSGQPTASPSEAKSVTKVADDVFLSWITMVSKNEVEEVIRGIQTYAMQHGHRNIAKKVTQLSSRWYKLKDEHLQGIVGAEEHRLNGDKIAHALIEVIYDLKDKHPH